ncbi:hypothetical protein BH18ACT6_BH18ACT6_18040 [soil metagenome]
MFLEMLIVACLRAPVAGPVVEGYSALSPYAGHHGIDLQAAFGTAVLAAASGSVNFAGSVAGMLTVTVDHGNGLRSTVSYLEDIEVSPGQIVATGQRLGASGFAHGDAAAVHFSVRVGDGYVDPMPYLLCGAGGPEHLYLLPPPPASYARHREKRPYGRNLRPTPYRPPPGRRGRLSTTSTRPRSVRPGWVAVAKGRQSS